MEVIGTEARRALQAIRRPRRREQVAGIVDGLDTPVQHAPVFLGIGDLDMPVAHGAGDLDAGEGW